MEHGTWVIIVKKVTVAAEGLAATLEEAKRDNAFRCPAFHNTSPTPIAGACPSPL